MQGGVQTWYTLNSTYGFKFMLTTIAKFLIFIRMHAYRSLIMRFYSYLFWIIFLGGKFCSFCGKSIVDKLSNASKKKKKKNWFS